MQKRAGRIVLAVTVAAMLFVKAYCQNYEFKDNPAIIGQDMLYSDIEELRMYRSRVWLIR